MPTPRDSIDSSGASPQDASGGPKFEQALARLEEIVHLLEDGKIGLDDALGRYEEGVGLLRKAYEMLEKAERRIALLTGFDSEGNPVLRPLEDTASYSSAADASGPPPSGPEKNTPRRSRRTAEPGMF